MIFAEDLARFLKAMVGLDTTGGPLAGARNHYRGCSLSHYDEQTRQAITKLDGKIDTRAATEPGKSRCRLHGARRLSGFMET